MTIDGDVHLIHGLVNLECEGFLQMVFPAEAMKSAWSFLVNIDVRAVSERVPLIDRTTARGQPSIHSTSVRAGYSGYVSEKRNFFAHGR